MTGWIIPVINGAINAGATASSLAQSFRDAKTIAQSVQQYDSRVMASAAQAIGQLNVQRAALYKATSSALFSIQQRKAQVQSQQSAMNAATDTVGASTLALLKDSQVQAAKAVGSVLYNTNVQDQSLYDAQRNVYQRASDSLKGDDLASIPSRGTTDRIVFQGFLQGFMGSGGGSSLVPSRTNPSAKDVQSADSYDAQRGHSYGGGSGYDASGYGSENAGDSGSSSGGDW